MAQDPNSSIPLDDEDILDLTEIAGPGQMPDHMSSEPDSVDSVDFGADLDALLDSLAPDGTSGSPKPRAGAAMAPETPVAAPIADQTPVSYQVDPDEEMAMPETTEINNLLAELGAEIPHRPASPAPQAARQAAPAPEFNGLLAQAHAAEAQKAAEEAAADLPGLPQPSPATPPADDDSLDLNELDALLDDILATAPEMSVAARNEVAAAISPEPVNVAPHESAPDVIPVPEAALVPSKVDPALAERMQRLEEVVERLGMEAGSFISAVAVEKLIDTKLAALLQPGSDFTARVCAIVLDTLTSSESGNENAAVFRAKLEKLAAAAAAKVIREEIAALISE